MEAANKVSKNNITGINVLKKNSPKFLENKVKSWTFSLK